MIVEDDHAIRETLREVLEEHGFGVLDAANGAEALESLRQHAPRVILLDLMMPILDGIGFREVQRSDPALARIPVVVISADHGVREKASTLGVDAYLAKPFELDQLLSTVRRYAA